ncbi:MAG TPA: glycosyltransferase, partial [Ignavibacteria bacterium]|nr:glycosyltransferase [Ignavibacteria bacterium]
INKLLKKLAENKNPNILIITSRADFGGGPKHISGLLNHLNDKINFYIACPKDYPYYDMFSSMIGEKRIAVIPHRRFSLLRFVSLIKFVKRKKIDLIHSHGKGAGIYSRMLSPFTDRPVIHTFHGLHIGEYNSVKRVLYLLVEKILSLFTKEFITVSDSERNQILLNKITNKNKLNKIENGVEIPRDKTASFNTTERKLNIVTISRFDFAKNSFLLIPILKELINKKSKFNFTISILGEGKGKENFKNEIASEGLSDNFKLLGAQINIAGYLINSFCYISTSKWEGMPLGVIEAMAVGLPVIATDVTGNKDVVKNNVNGFLFEIEKPEEAAAFILRLAEDNDLWNRLSNSSKELTQKYYSAERMANETLDLYNRILNN